MATFQLCRLMITHLPIRTGPGGKPSDAGSCLHALWLCFSPPPVCCTTRKICRGILYYMPKKTERNWDHSHSKWCYGQTFSSSLAVGKTCCFVMRIADLHLVDVHCIPDFKFLVLNKWKTLFLFKGGVNQVTLKQKF